MRYLYAQFLLNILMETKFVQVLMDITINWQGDPPQYRVYVADELFSERTFDWQDHYLEELLQIEAPAGKYPIRVELTDPTAGELKLKNMRIEYGPGSLYKGTLEIH